MHFNDELWNKAHFNKKIHHVCLSVCRIERFMDSVKAQKYAMKSFYILKMQWYAVYYITVFKSESNEENSQINLHHTRYNKQKAILRMQRTRLLRMQNNNQLACARSLNWVTWFLLNAGSWYNRSERIQSFILTCHSNQFS